MIILAPWDAVTSAEHRVRCRFLRRHGAEDPPSRPACGLELCILYVRCALIIKEHKRHQTQLRQRRFRQHRLATFRVNSGQPLSDNGQRTTALRTTAFDGSGQPLSRHGGRAADNRFAQRTTAFAHLLHIHIYVHICLHTRARIQVYRNVRMHMCVCMYVCAGACVCASVFFAMYARRGGQQNSRPSAEDDAAFGVRAAGLRVLLQELLKAAS